MVARGDPVEHRAEHSRRGGEAVKRQVFILILKAAAMQLSGEMPRGFIQSSLSGVRCSRFRKIR